MKTYTYKCVHCGELVKVSGGKRVGTCEYCGSSSPVPPEIIHEMDREIAEKKAEQEAKRREEEAKRREFEKNNSSDGGSSYVPSKHNTTSGSKAKWIIIALVILAVYGIYSAFFAPQKPENRSLEYDLIKENLNIEEVETIKNDTFAAKGVEHKTFKGKFSTSKVSETYSYKAPRTGNYSFLFSGLGDTEAISISAYDAYGDLIDYNNECGNGNGLYVRLKKNQKISIHLSSFYCYGSYKMTAYAPKERENVSKYYYVDDSIEYRGQVNEYKFKPARNGIYSFEIGNYDSNAHILLSVYDSNGNECTEEEYNSDTLITMIMSKGEEYTIKISEYDGYDFVATAYKLRLGKQKEYQNISAYDGVRDSIEFTNQENIYMFTPKETADYDISVYEISSSCAVGVVIFNENGEIREQNDYMVSGDHFPNTTLIAGEAYEIHVYQSSGETAYALVLTKPEE